MHRTVPESIDLRPGTLLSNGRYRIERELNRGGTAAVYAAQDSQTQGAWVALKVMRGPEQVPALYLTLPISRFLLLCPRIKQGYSHFTSRGQVPVHVVKREIAFSSGMKHDNIVRLLDVFAEGHTLVIVVGATVADKPRCRSQPTCHSIDCLGGC